MTQIKLEVGKKYRNRIGEVVEIAGEKDCPDYPFYAIGQEFTEDGHFTIGELEHYLDLIEEVTEEPAKKPHKWAAILIAIAEGREVEYRANTLAETSAWCGRRSENVNPITYSEFEWRIKRPQWQQNLIDAAKAGEVVEMNASEPVAWMYKYESDDRNWNYSDDAKFIKSMIDGNHIVCESLYTHPVKELTEKYMEMLGVCKVFEDYLIGPTAWTQEQVDNILTQVRAILRKAGEK